MQIKNGFLFDDSGKQVPYKPTPNHGGTLAKPEYLIIHFTADTNPAATIGWFLNKAAQASAHLLIDREGNITQFAPFSVVCWHAGASAWNGISGLNSRSIGIELTNAGRVVKQGNTFRCSVDNGVVPADQVALLKHKNEKVATYWQTYTTKQLAAAARVAEILIKTYGLKDVLGHDDIAPGRKTDPGPAFDMPAFKVSAGNKPVEYKTTTVSLNVRSGPGTTFSILSTLPAGTRVAVEQSTGNWSKINVPSNGLNGFVNNQYLK
jgi:N-acetylmuramoyl-L-alanine amidase